MLHRLPHHHRLTMQAAPSRQGGRQRTAVSATSRRWLTAPGSLTARLRQLGPVRVQVLKQGHQRLWPQEQAAIHSRCGHVREVLLWVDQSPAVWARSVTSPRALKGPWRALKGLGTRPLAELLFEHRGVQRDALQHHRFAAHGRQMAHLSRAWRLATEHSPVESLESKAQEMPTWARRSVFTHRGHPLQVMECFAPWVLSRRT